MKLMEPVGPFSSSPASMIRASFPIAGLYWKEAQHVRFILSQLHYPFLVKSEKHARVFVVHNRLHIKSVTPIVECPRDASHEIIVTSKRYLETVRLRPTQYLSFDH
jgi:hypothetical protein